MNEEETRVTFKAQSIPSPSAKDLLKSAIQTFTLAELDVLAGRLHKAAERSCVALATFKAIIRTDDTFGQLDPLDKAKALSFAACGSLDIGDFGFAEQCADALGEIDPARAETLRGEIERERAKG